MLEKVLNSNKSVCLENLDEVIAFRNCGLNEQINELNGRRFRPSSNSFRDKFFSLELTNVEDIKVSTSRSNPLITIIFSEDKKKIPWLSVLLSK